MLKQKSILKCGCMKYMADVAMRIIEHSPTLLRFTYSYFVSETDCLASFLIFIFIIFSDFHCTAHKYWDGGFQELSIDGGLAALYYEYCDPVFFVDSYVDVSGGT